MQDKSPKNHLVVLLVELLLLVGVFGILSVTISQPIKTQALGGVVLVGGKLSPGAPPPLGLDIFTFSPCGLLVTVVGPNPGVFVWNVPIYRGFFEHPTHIGDDILGIALPPIPPCPPVLTTTFGTTSYLPY